MGISLAVSKFDVDVPRLKYDQNRPAGTQDKCHLIESYICQNAFLIGGGGALWNRNCFFDFL